jgi:hypothetical protein
VLESVRAADPTRLTQLFLAETSCNFAPTTMDHFLTLLSKPIVLTEVTLTIGSYLFNRLTELRSKRDKIRENALQLLEEVGNDLNSIISLMYGHIRTSNFDIRKDSLVHEKRGGLFTKRFSVRIRSRVFLQSEEFWQRYEQLTFEIDRIVRLMGSLSETYDVADVIKRIEEHRNGFAKDWPFEERSTTSKYPPPSNELVKWTDMVWDRAVWWLSENLNIILR